MTTLVYNLDLLNELNAKYEKIKFSFSKQQIKHYVAKDFAVGMFNKIFYPSYYKREKLVKFGAIQYVFTFRITDFTFETSELIPTWILYSPNLEFRKDPKLYFDIAKRINSFINGELNYKNKKLLSSLLSDENNYQYYQLPKEIVGNCTVFYSLVYKNMHTNYFLDIGINFAFVNRNISKEIIYVPEDIMQELLNGDNKNV